ncbi:RDD family protein [Murinocardiopsis flavida]|uniref:RDD family protein n=1 Tax=Murinocardiopsis flavida TaxID=645275 RepID=A0A2P8D3I9_9ACTN|nr:RDD family protein [Murinocardiopsis flavida]PSK91784.1 RDD family protein [Murinocardiopsis flavida]
MDDRSQRPAPPLAPWGPRAAARLVDVAVVTIPALIVALVFSLIWMGAQLTLNLASNSSGATQDKFAVIFSVALYLCLTAYDVVTLTKLRKTFGKHLLKIRVASLDNRSFEQPIPFSTVLVRAAVFHLWVLFFWTNIVLVAGLAIASLIAYVLWPLWDTPYRQGLHDKLARTVVVRTG